MVTSTACNGVIDEEDDAARARCSAPPESAVTSRSDILRLDVVDLGEGHPQSGSAASLGMNLDGRCSTNADETHACARTAGTPARFHADGPNGVDNAFGTAILPLLFPFDARPSEGAAGTSFLVFAGEGRATFYLGTRTGHVRAVIPLTSVRTASGDDGFVTLAAIIPRDALVESVRARANVLLDETSNELCAGSALEAVLATIQQAADIPLSGSGDPGITCDGISIGLRFRASPAAEAPALLPGCTEQ